MVCTGSCVGLLPIGPGNEWDGTGQNAGHFRDSKADGQGLYDLFGGFLIVTLLLQFRH